MPTTSPRHADSNASDSSDSEDDFLRLASESARKKAGLVKPTSPRRHQGSLTEKSTKALQKAHRKTTFIVAGQNAVQRRLEATKSALEAKSKSLAMDTNPQSPSIFERKEANIDEQHTLPELSFQYAPADVQQVYQEGYAYVRQGRWKEATAEWEKILETQDADASIQDDPASLDWLLPLLGQLAFAYKKLGLLRRALACYDRIRRAIVANHTDVSSDRLDFVGDALYQMSAIYHELGDMESAMECTENANAILLKLMGSSVDSPEEAARVAALHRNRELTRMLKDAACGDFGTVDDQLSSLENHEAFDISIEDFANFVDPTTGATFLMVASGCGQMPLLTKLCHETTNWKSQVEIQDGCGNTALAWACKFGQTHAIQFLLDNGASFQALNMSELKTWPKTSLQCIQEHIQKRKREKTQPKKKSQLYKPLIPVESPSEKPVGKSVVQPTEKPVQKPVEKIETSFNAAPPSAAAASGALVGRKLEAWTPEADDETSISRHESLGEAAGEWDQFEANKRLFGVTSEFKEDLYTTKLQKASAAQERAAKALAAEIMAQGRSEFKHVNEERGLENDESYDPEARYGAVLGTDNYASEDTKHEDEDNDKFTDRGVLLNRQTM
ncbi:hypothetical protein LEN26_014011 [Aphanomyces euteiches]|nr:hypothetical protein LEN26_014011 [Aphanomyces euteiches]KAH9116626.1 hypothetical protein AeMF1_009478 [Aphanomyces euteiches]KAH9191444.1 hypothetical protein AeNC1_006571 [Aphanomyces euteiches]